MRTTVDVTIVEVTYGALSPMEITQALTDLIKRHDELLIQADDSLLTRETWSDLPNDEVK